MTQYQKTKQPSPFLYSKLMFVLLACGVILLSYSLIGMIHKVYETGKASASAEAKANALTQKKLELEANVALLGTEEGVESIIREKFPVVKNGEEMIVITEPEEVREAVPTEAPHGRFVSFFLNLFK